MMVVIQQRRQVSKKETETTRAQLLVRSRKKKQGEGEKRRGKERNGLGRTKMVPSRGKKKKELGILDSSLPSPYLAVAVKGRLCGHRLRRWIELA